MDTRNIKSLDDEQLEQVAGGGSFLDQLRERHQAMRRQHFIDKYLDETDTRPAPGTLYRIWTGRTAS